MSSHKGPNGHGHTGTPPTPPTIAQAADAAFTKFDTDSNGTITSAELLSVLDPKGTHADAASDVAALITAVDTGADGTLSKAEVTAALTQLDTNGDGSLSPADHVAGSTPDAADHLLGALLGRGGPGHGDGGGGGDHGAPPPVQTVTQVVDALFTGFDADTSTTIALSELLAVVNANGTDAHHSTEVTTLFGLLDSNADASLSQAEVTAAVTALDSNADGTLDHSDFAPGQPQTNPHDNVLELMGVLHHLQADAAGGGAILG
jgi:Ca2+-binding EF-hand superfamily protein